MEKVGKVPVRVLKDVPEFGNRLQHAMWLISLREKNIASAEDIDKVVKYGFGARMPFIGPLETGPGRFGLTCGIHKYLFPYLESSQNPSRRWTLPWKPRCYRRQGPGGVFTNGHRKSLQQVIQQRDAVLLHYR